MRHAIGFLRFALAAALLASAGPALALNPNHQCSFCHNLHGGAVITPAAQQQAMCLTCHGPAGVSTMKAAEHRNAQNSGYPTFNFSCRNCHDPHASRQNWQGRSNIKMVGIDVDGTGLAKIATPGNGTLQVVFESMGTTVGQPSLHSQADNNQDNQSIAGQAWDGPCEVCHTRTKFHRNNASSTHNTGKTCTAQCHTHAWGFMRQALP